MLTNLGESGSTPWYLKTWGGSSGFRVYRVEGLGGGLGNWDFALWLGLCGLALGLSILGLRLLVLVTRINLVLFLSLKAGSQAAMNCFFSQILFCKLLSKGATLLSILAQ